MLLRFTPRSPKWFPPYSWYPFKNSASMSYFPHAFHMSSICHRLCSTYPNHRVKQSKILSSSLCGFIVNYSHPWFQLFPCAFVSKTLPCKRPQNSADRKLDHESWQCLLALRWLRIWILLFPIIFRPICNTQSLIPYHTESITSP